ncbi:hypothetical protein LBMAG53_20870 [Planctomycetota bacterium]|nr:hypothetical protein LBMAG53_20870 [Planctomycetota bacterium]
MNATQLSRRHLLGAGAAAIALPWLESLVPRLSAGEPVETAPASSGPRNRLVCICFAHGVCNQQWYPAETGTDWQLTPSLMPLGDVKKRCTIFTGFNHRETRDSIGHEGTDSWLTGRKMPASGISMDQVAAAACRGATRFESLQLGPSAGTGTRGRSLTCSFNASGIQLPAMASPRALFSRLFTADTAPARAALSAQLTERRSVLDALVKTIGTMQCDLPSADRGRLDQYLESVRSVELQVAREQAWCQVPKPKGPEAGSIDLAVVNGPDHGAWLAVMYQLIVLAFATDATRVVTFCTMSELTNGGSWPELGIASDHGISHHNGQARNLELIAKRDHRGMSLLTEKLLRPLQDLHEGGESALDRTMILYGSGMNNSLGLDNGTGVHSGRKLPLLLAGGERCGIKQGSHVRLADDDGPPLANVYLTMLRAFGSKAERFADSTGTLRELTA